MRKSWIAGALGLLMLAAAHAQQAATENVAQQAIPDAPKPQALPGLGSVAPGKGSTSGSDAPAAGHGGDALTPAAPTAAQKPEPADDQSLEGVESRDTFTLAVHANFVVVPFTVKDSKGRPVAGLQPRDVQVYENGLLQHISAFSADPYPLSVAMVIDQSMTHDDMQRVNDSLGALPGAFAAYDAVALFTYNNGPHIVTDFTGAQSARLTQALEISKGSGRDALLAGDLDGPTSQNTVINNQNFDPNTSANRGHSGISINPPKDFHTLNDAIFEAAKALVKAAPGPERRRVIYVISNGREYGSEAKMKDVIQYLQTNNIEVDATLVGDSSLPVIGFLNKLHLPLTMRDNVLPNYTSATGGNIDAEFRTGEIEKSYTRIADEVRNRYVLGYTTHEPFIDGKYRTLNVVIKGHGDNLDVIAKKGYYPSAMDAVRQQPIAVAK